MCGEGVVGSGGERDSVVRKWRGVEANGCGAVVLGNTEWCDAE